MVTSTAKKGRPTAYHRTAWGEKVDGLKRLADGRWKVSGPPVVKFTESDERLAVARFYEMKSKQNGDVVDIPTTHTSIDDAADAFIRRLPNNERTYLELPVESDDDEPVVVSNWQPSAAVWAWFRHQVITQPKWVAKMTGVEELAYLTDLEKPTKSPKLVDLIELYAARPTISAEEVSRCRRFWSEFVSAVGVKTLRELTHEDIERYEKKVTGLALSAKSVKHRFSRIKTVIAYALKRGKSPKECRAALDKFAGIEVPAGNTLDPDPIHPDDFWKVHAEAVKAGNHAFAAMMLFSANCALYPSEAGAVRWEDIDLKRGEFVTRRNKTKVPRVGVLWPETIKAIKALPEDRTTVFNTSRQGYKRHSVFRDWKLYRDAAGLPKVKFAQIRDAAFTIACRVSLDKARVLSGHRMPGAVDAYVLRQPQFVADACSAIHGEFYAKPAKSAAEDRQAKAESAV